MKTWEVTSASLGGGSLQVQSPRTEVTLPLSKPWSLARGLLGISLDGGQDAARTQTALSARRLGISGWAFPT